MALVSIKCIDILILMLLPQESIHFDFVWLLKILIGICVNNFWLRILENLFLMATMSYRYQMSYFYKISILFYSHNLLLVVFMPIGLHQLYMTTSWDCQDVRYSVKTSRLLEVSSLKSSNLGGVSRKCSVFFSGARNIRKGPKWSF